ncbi:MAG: aspartate aminotransferase family protein [Lentisphaerae bacterium]|nr:aspartate aminotransferase family protein [Lentisphaerota bacterium]
MTENSEVAELFSNYVIPNYARKPIAFVRGKGTRVWDSSGKVYLDFLGGIAVQGAGHCHPEITKAIQAQAERLVHVSNLYWTENQGLLARELSGLSLKGKCFFCNSGAEANEALIKLARYWGREKGKFEIVSMKNSFHGRTLATLSATGQAKVQAGFEPLAPGFVYADFNNLASVRDAVTEHTAAVLVEAVQGEGGVIPAQPDFMKGLRELCDEKGILLLCDEIQCGMGRTGSWFGFQAYGIEPDAISLAKGLGNGFPIGAIVTKPGLSDVLQPGTHGSTFGGTPLACAAALATISVIRGEKLVERAAAAGEKFQSPLKAMVGKHAHLAEVRGAGLMVGLVLDQPAKDLADKLVDMGLLCLATAGNVIRFLPPLNVKDSEIEDALDIINDAFDEWNGTAAPEEEAKPADA